MIYNSIDQEILDFTKRRFPNDQNWRSGNCFYYSLILKTRFPKGNICYDTVSGHFVLLYDGKYYDWSGEYSPADIKTVIPWDEFENYDPLQYQRIVRDCIM